jgi:hypothetical protein
MNFYPSVALRVEGKLKRHPTEGRREKSIYQGKSVVNDKTGTKNVFK